MKNGITHENEGVKVQDLSEQQIAELTEVYICPSFGCNLQCPHCTLRNIKMPTDLDAICNTLDYLLDKSPKLMYFTIFGGEPLLLNKEVWDKIEPRVKQKDYSISTNLLNLDDTNLQYLKRCIMPDTSWNPKRFGTEENYNKWLSNLEILHNNSIEFEVMVTLTKDLINDYTPTQFIEECHKWGATLVRFEQMIGDDTLDFNDVDKWLCDVYDLWDEATCGKNVLFSKLARVANGDILWAEHCESTFTIMPNGNVKPSCPYFEVKVQKKDCLTCEFGDICKGGCPLQEHCTFPKQTYLKIKGNLNNIDMQHVSDDSMYAGSRCMCKKD